jgi:hypothetical protein
VLCCAATGTTEKYWDLFSMRYNLGQPLASIFTPEAQEKYNRLTKLLWRLRRAERALNDAWRILKVGLLGCHATAFNLPSIRVELCGCWSICPVALQEGVTSPQGTCRAFCCTQHAAQC